MEITMKRTWVHAIAVFLIVLSVASGAKYFSSKAQVVTGKAVATADSDVVQIPVSEITSQAKFYSFDSGGVKINYFVVMGSDGKIRTAFDACDVCGGYKGYRQKASDMICNNCGRYFDIDSIGTKNRGGGCWPSYLPREIKSDKIIIKKQDLEKGRRFFK